MGGLFWPSASQLERQTVYGYGGGMNDEQWKAMYCYFSNWFNMASVAFLMVGAFQKDHVFGGLIGATISGLMGLVFKLWSKK